MRDLLMVVPSRGRPGNIRRLADAMFATCEGDTDLVVGLDTDDPAREDYPGIFDNRDRRRRWYAVRPDLRKVTAWCNELAVLHQDEYRNIGHFGDDNLPQTPGWDTQLVAALEKTPFAFGNDQFPGREPGTLSCHILMRSAVVRALGYFGPPPIAHMYVDVAWYAWGTACGITYLPEVNLEHLHYTSGRSAHDLTYAISFAGTSKDLGAWHGYSRGGALNADIGKLGGEPFTPEGLAEFNRRLNIPDHWPG